MQFICTGDSHTIDTVDTKYVVNTVDTEDRVKTIDTVNTIETLDTIQGSNFNMTPSLEKKENNIKSVIFNILVLNKKQKLH